MGKHDKILANRIEWALQHNEAIDQINTAEKVCVFVYGGGAFSGCNCRD